MSTLREVFEEQTVARRAEARRALEGGPGVLPGNFQKPVLQMVQSELFLDIFVNTISLYCNKMCIKSKF